MRTLNNMMIGTAGELRVMAELILQGFNPAKSYLDNGVDIILNNGVRIQVKTAMYKQKTICSKCYRIQLRKGNRKKRADISTYADFLIGYVIPENAFFVIPTNILKGMNCLAFTMKPNMTSKYKKYINNWDLLRR